MYSANDSVTQTPTVSYEVTAPVRIAYQTVSGAIAIIQLYILIALISYEWFVPGKPPTGRKLRVLCLLAVATSFAHECLQQMIVTYSGASDVACYAMMTTKSTVYNAVITWSYAFFWLRQRMFYSSPTLRHLQGKAMSVVTWVILFLLCINPCIMLGFQFKDKLYQASGGVCLVLRQPIVDQLPFIAVAFSYSFIQVALIFLYFYPLYKRNIPQGAPRKPSTTPSIDPTSPTVVFSATEVTKTDPAVDDAKNKNRFSLALDKAKLKIRTVKISPKHKGSSNIRSLERRMKRWLVLGLVCVTSDVISATIIAVFLLSVTPASLVTIMFLWHDVSMLISVFCTVGCFNEYKVMLFPFKVIHNCHRK